jgi:hypothetical protein
MKPTKRKKNLQYESEATIKTPVLPPSVEEIRRRAREISMARGGAPGKELDDWLAAERELHRERSGECGKPTT